MWGYHHPGDTKLVNVHMTRLRSKIEDDAEIPRSSVRSVESATRRSRRPDALPRRFLAPVDSGRVVTSTILLSALVISLTGWALLRDVASGLAENRRTAVISEARSGFEVRYG